MLLGIPINLLTEAIWPWYPRHCSSAGKRCCGVTPQPSQHTASCCPTPSPVCPGDGPQMTINSTMFYKVIILTRKIDYFKITQLKNRNHSFTTGLKQFFHTCGMPYFQYGSVNSKSQWVLWFLRALAHHLVLCKTLTLFIMESVEVFH